MLCLDGVSKRYGRDTWVLRDADLAAHPGDVVAVVGGNGSGKSTLLRIAAGLSRAARGAVTARASVVGYVPDRFTPRERMSASGYLAHLGRIRGLSTAEAAARAELLLERLELAADPHAPLRTLSKGNAQKVALAQAFLVSPELLILDEPWSGLDACAHDVLAELMAEVADAGGAVLFTDHREAVTRAHATRTYAVADASLVPVEPLPQTDPPRPPYDVVLTAGDRAQAAAQPSWHTQPGVLDASQDSPRVRLTVARDAVDGLLLTALQHGWSVEHVGPAIRSVR